MAGNFLSEWTSPSNARLVGYVIVPWRVFHLSRDSSKDFFRTNLNHQFIREVRYTLYCCRSFVEFHTYWQTIILFDTPMGIVLVKLRVQEFTSNGNSRKQGIRRHKNHLKKPMNVDHVFDHEMMFLYLRFHRFYHLIILETSSAYPSFRPTGVAGGNTRSPVLYVLQWQGPSHGLVGSHAP